MKKNIFERSGKEKQVFKDEKYLYPEFVPERLPHRDREIDALVYGFNPLVKGGKPHNFFVVGPTGVGKTACVKYVLNELQEYSDRAKALYLNCFEFNARHAILSKIANFLGAPVPRRGIATDEIYSRFLEALKKADFSPVIVLDEVDQLLLKADGSKLLYDLLRVVEYERARVALVLISNDIELTAKLDSRVRSSLTEEKIVFESYTPAQLKDILRERASFAFLSGALGEEVIPVAAAHAAKLGGDARIAIESLLKAGREAEKENSGKVEVKHLKKSFESVDAVSLLKGIRHLNESEALLLKLIAEKPGIFSGELFKAFGGKTEPLSERRLRDLLNGLEKKNFVFSEQVSLGNKGKTRSFSCRLPREPLMRELNRNQ